MSLIGSLPGLLADCENPCPKGGMLPAWQVLPILWQAAVTSSPGAGTPAALSPSPMDMLILEKKGKRQRVNYKISQSCTGLDSKALQLPQPLRGLETANILCLSGVIAMPTLCTYGRRLVSE